MASEDLSFFITGTHMKMCIELAVHSVDRSVQGYNLIISLKIIGIIFFLPCLKHSRCEIIDRAQGGDAGQFYVLF